MDLAVKRIFPCSITITHPPFKLKKTSAPVRTCIGKRDKGHQGGGHRVTSPPRGPAKIFFYKVCYPLYTHMIAATATSLMVPKIRLFASESSPVYIGL